MEIEVPRASLKYLHSIAYEKHPSRKVMNFRHLLGCDTIDNDVTALNLNKSHSDVSFSLT